MCRARHPNVMKAYGISFHMSGRPTIVMPWYGNGTAREYLQTNPGADRLHLVRLALNAYFTSHASMYPRSGTFLKGCATCTR